MRTRDLKSKIRKILKGSGWTDTWAYECHVRFSDNEKVLFVISLGPPTALSIHVYEPGLNFGQGKDIKNLEIDGWCYISHERFLGILSNAVSSQ